MKKVIAATGRSVFQLCKAWRNAESVSPIHNPEFTMLEYYGVGLSSEDNIGLTEELFEALADEKTPQHARPPFRVMSMREAFLEFCPRRPRCAYRTRVHARRLPSAWAPGGSRRFVG